MDSRSTVNFMIDLETMGLSVNSAILSIGIQPFITHVNKSGELQDSSFYRNISLESSSFHMFGMDVQTILWWFRQSKEAINSWNKDGISVKQACSEMTDYVCDVCNLYGIGLNNVLVWSHGSCFDIPILENFYKVLGEKPFWHYKNVRDTRTIFDLASLDYDSFYKDSNMIKHNALHDANRQARAVIAAYTMLVKPVNYDIYYEAYKLDQQKES